MSVTTLRPTSALKPLLLVALLALSACDSAEERAEKYYQSGIALLEAGDVDRALVEFRNVFKLNGQHKEARLTYARIQRERGRLQEAFSQYLRVAEQYPDTLEAHVALAEIAIENGQWDQAERYGREAQKLGPQDLATRGVVVALDYRKALLAEDEAGRDAARQAAEALLEVAPENLNARRVVIDGLATAGDTAGALAQIDQALVLDPDQLELQMLRLRLIASTGDQAQIGEQLKDMFARFPKNREVRQLLVSWYIQQGDNAGAESVLRKLAEQKPNDTAGWLTLVQFQRQTMGVDAAYAELDRLIAQGGDNATLYRATRAALSFEETQDPTAIAEMETLVRDAAPSEQTRNMKIALAQMLDSTGNTVGARARIEEVLVEDPSNVEALKMRAVWLIQDDKPGDAILALRTALDQSPRDPEILTLMGQAHERDGSRELAGERYALAVDVSGNAPEESLRYANFLIADNRVDAAGVTLEDALRVSPDNVGLIVLLADVRMRQNDWARTNELIARLRAIGNDQAMRAANGLEAGLMLRQEKTDETVGFLQGLIDSGEASTAAVATIVQTRVREGDIASAREYLDEQMVKNPDDASLRLLNAGLYVLENNPALAEETYRALIAEFPQSEQPVRGLYALLLWQGRPADAAVVLDAALQAMPGSGTLRVMKATELEQANDIDGAIAVYEQLYAEDTSNMIIANNLSSLITAHRSDPESLERAFAIARRLRGIDVPAFQDTYGWIEYRRGNYEEALANLEPAAKGLPQDPLVQYHLGMTYLALDRKEDARKQLELALEIAGDSPLPQFAEARKQLETLDAAPAGGETTTGSP
jgi:tetratricopeptide (TPR) repeat protein